MLFFVGLHKLSFLDVGNQPTLSKWSQDPTGLHNTRKNIYARNYKHDKNATSQKSIAVHPGYKSERTSSNIVT